jgi:hypothetical protein
VDAQQLHLVVNHVPVVGSLWVLLLLLFALIHPKRELSHVALTFTVLLGVSALPAFLTGGPAEELVEHLPRVVEETVEEHEEAGELALAVTLGAGLVGLIGMVWSARRPGSRTPLFLAWLAVAGAAAVLAWTAHLGGRIQRPELL